MPKFFLIDGLKIEVVKVEPTTDVRFFPQKALLALGTAAAQAELARRADICRARA